MQYLIVLVCHIRQPILVEHTDVKAAYTMTFRHCSQTAAELIMYLIQTEK